MKLCTIAGRDVFQDAGGRVYYRAGAMIDADGSPNAYKPDNSGLDDLCNARDGDEWCGIVTNSDGSPYITPAGGYVSPTAYQWRGQPVTSPARYVDSEKVPFIVVPPQIRQLARGVVLGCKARLNFNGKQCLAVVADIGPHSKLGEISIAAAEALGIPSSPRNGGTDEELLYELWPGTHAVLDGVTYDLIPMKG